MEMKKIPFSDPIGPIWKTLTPNRVKRLRMDVAIA